MPRALKEIRNFDKGMFSRVEGSDLNQEIAALALDVDPDAPRGLARGRKNASDLGAITGFAEFNRMKMMQESDDSKNLVGIDFSDNEAGIIENYDGTPSYTNLGAVVHNNRAAIQILNNQAYIGLGGTATAIPKWVGQVNNDQFGVTPSGNWEMDDADLKPPKIVAMTCTDNIKSAGVLATSLTVTDGDYADLPTKGALLFYFPNATNSVPSYGIVTYTTRTGATFGGLDFGLDGANIPSNWNLSSDGGESYYAGKLIYLEVGLGTYFSNEFNGGNTVSGGGIGSNPAFNYQGQDEDGFDIQTHYVVGASFVYDNYKESPITRIPSGSDFWSGFTTNQNTYSSVDISLFLQGFHSSNPTMSKRVTAVRIYLAPGTGAIGSEGGEQPLDGFSGSFRLATQIDITEALDNVFTSGEAIAYGYKFTQKGYQGTTFTDSSGLSEAVRSTTINYGMSTQLNNELFVAEVYNPQAPDEDWSNYVVKSESLVFENFDWSLNYTVLPNPVTAIATYEGRVYAFDEYNMYRINPQYMNIEDVYQGVGALNQEAITTSEFGMFIANNYGIYIFNGREINHISEPVDEIEAIAGYDNYGYRNFVQQVMTNTSGDNLMLSFDSEMNTLVIFAKTATLERFWLFNVERKAWFCSSADGREYPAICLSHRNSILASGAADGKIYELFRDSTRKVWTWATKKMSMEGVSQIKKFRKVIVDASASVTTTYQIDDTGGFANISGLDSSVVASNGNWIQIIVTPSAGTTELYSVGVLYRRRSLPA